LVVPKISKSTKGGRVFSHLAPKLWNRLPDNVPEGMSDQKHISPIYITLNLYRTHTYCQLSIFIICISSFVL